MEVATSHPTLPPVEETVDRPDTASMTLLKRMNVCPRSAYLDLKYRQVALQTAPMARGTAFHDFAERAIKLLIEQDEPSMPGEVARDLMQSVIDERKDLALTAQEIDHLRAMAFNFGTASFFDLKGIVGIEDLLTLNIGGWTVRGRVDLIEVSDTLCSIRDWKTSYYLPPTDEVRHDPQLLIYALLAMEGTPEDRPYSPAEGCNEFRCRLVFPRYTTDETGELVEREVMLTRTEIHEFRGVVERWLEQLDHGFETGEWPASPGSHCSICPAASECPIPEALREVETIETAEQAQDMAARHAVIDIGQRRLKKGLKGYAEDNGDIPFGDYVMTFSKVESHPVDREALEAAAKLGQPFDPDAMFETKVSTRFDKRKIKKQEESDAA